MKGIALIKGEKHVSKGKYQKQNKNRMPILYYLLLLTLIAVFIGCAWYLGSYFMKSQQQAEEYNDLAALVESLRENAPTVEPDLQQPKQTQPDGLEGQVLPVLPPAKLQDVLDENGILLEYAPLYEMNSDMAGWLTIEGTRINYPVMHTPGRPDYYLERSFDGKYNPWGCIYAREECDLETPSDNVTLYGHNMKDGSMFAGLNAYSNREFWQEHRYIRFDTIREHHTYEIFAVFTTTASEGQGFDYHNFINAADEIAFDTFIAKCLSLSLYGTDIVPEYGDKIICLSTCEYSQINGRLIIAAVRIS